MAYSLTAALALGAASAAFGMTVDHRTQMDHRHGPVAVTYRGDVAIQHRQVGTTAPGGRSASLRCDWAASMTVARHAKAATGASHSRSVDSGPVLSGTRSGWCSANHAAIRQEVAGRASEMHRHLVAFAQQDDAELRAELDHAYGMQRSG